MRRADGQPWRRTPPPKYERKRLEERPRRDRWWRRDAHIAIDAALVAGELTLHVASLLRAVLSFSDDRGQVIWAGQSKLGEAMGGRSDRTARRWLRQAEAAGWVKIEHRAERHEGRWRSLSNLTMVVLPPEVEARRQERKAPNAAPSSRPPVPQQRPVVQDHERSQQAAEALALLDDPTPPAPPSSPLAQRARRLAAKAPPGE